jgi:hypothetical protein
VTKHRRRDKESVAKSHRNKIAEQDRLKHGQNASDTSTGSSRGELSTAMPWEAKPPEVLDSGAAFVVI